MDLTKKIFAVLKPKAGAFGFNRKELMGVAADIANNLHLEEDASEEDINAAVNEAVDAVVPMLRIGQTMATRVINKAKASQRKTDDDDIDDDDDDNDDDDEPKSQKPKSQKSKATKAGETQEEPKWVADLRKSVETLAGQVASMKGEKLTDSRKTRLKEILKDTGSFGAMTLKNFEKMSFEDDDAFEDYLSEVEDGLKALNQERADAGLAHLGTPPATEKRTESKKPEVVTEEQIEGIAKMF